MGGNCICRPVKCEDIDMKGRNNNYCLCYRGKTDLSNIIYHNNNMTNNKMELLIYGYIRNVNIMSNITDIINICFRYCFKQNYMLKFAYLLRNEKKKSLSIMNINNGYIKDIYSTI